MLVLKKIATQFMLSLVLLATFVAPLHLQFEGASPTNITLTGSSAQAQGNAPAEDALQSTYALPVCFNLSEGFSVTGCAGQLLYWVLWWPTQWLAARAGGFLDYFIFFSIDSSTYRGVPFEDAQGNPTSFILEGWKIVRDISNVLFIFGLIYIAFGFVLRVNIGNANPKKLLVYLIVMALLINFSLFFARVITDAGNILARTLYNQIDLVAKGNANSNPTGPDGVKSIGIMFISLSNPQALMAPEQSNGTTFTDVDAESNIFVMMTMGAIIFNIFLIYIFISVAVYFIARIIGLYYSMIFSPFAFASMAIPKASSIDYIGFNSWLSNLVNYSFLAPLFIFFLYLTIKFLDLGIPINPNVAGSTPLAQTFMSIMIPFALAIGFLVLGKQQAKKMSGKLGEVTSKVVTSAVAGAAGVAVGAAAFGATQTVGRAAKMVGNSEKLKELGRTGNTKLFGKEFKLGKAGQALGKATVFGGNRLSRQTFDVRKSKRAAQILTSTAAITGTKLPSINTGIAAKEGGFSGYQQRKMEDQLKTEKRREEELKMSDAEARRRDAEAKKHNKDLNQDQVQAYEQAKATAEESYQGTRAYKNADEMTKERMLDAMRTQFDEDYQNGVVTTGYDKETGEAQKQNALEDRVEQEIKQERLDKLKVELEKTPAWQRADEKDRQRLAETLANTFEESYKKGEVITSVDNDGSASPSTMRVESRDDVDRDWETRRKAEIATEYLDTTKYKRMKTSTEINNERIRSYALSRQTKILPSISRSEAAQKYGAETLGRLNKEALSADHVKKLTNNLTNLNDTLGSYLHLQQTLGQDAFEKLSGDDLVKLADAVTDTQKKDALERAQQQDARQTAKVFDRMSAKLSAEISVIEAKMKNTSDDTKLRELAFQKRLLENRRRGIDGGFDEAARITSQINSARGNS